VQVALQGQLQLIAAPQQELAPPPVMAGKAFQ